MCLNLNLFLLSPLEQFEISSYNTFLNYNTTFPVELFDNCLNIFFNQGVFYNIIDFLFIYLVVKVFQLLIKQDGFLFLYIFMLVVFTCINIFGFSDFVISEINYNQPYFDLVEMKQYSANFVEKFIYVTINTSFINVYTVFFCFVFIYLVIYLFFNKSLSNNSNTLIPNMFQMNGENIYKVSLNLFFSVLGKHLAIPEFFIKINTIFLFLIISNVQGMIPYMSTLTSALTNTFFIALALFISILLTLFDKKGLNYFLNLFMPSGCPIFLILLLVPIEIISYSFRVVSLSVRLFANMMAGHTLLKVIVGFS
jgi:F-type H+-transporting ATPase subunit a